MTSYTLADIAEAILSGHTPQEKQYQALDAFAEQCAFATGIEPDKTFNAWADDTTLNTGIAINPQAAAYCIKDYQRSIQFLRGIYAALKTKENEQNEKTVRVLYAGCGPFATLLLPLLNKLNPKAFEIHVLDIHPHSLDSVAMLIDHFNATDFNITYHAEDASTFKHSSLFDIIIAETMQKALEQEPQFSVTENLVKLLKNNGTFIPGTIELDIWLAHWDSERKQIKDNTNKSVFDTLKKDRQHLALAMSLNVNSATKLSLNRSSSQDSEKPVLILDSFRTPAISENIKFDIIMSTKIQVYGDYWLNEYDCDLTLTYKFYEISPALSERTYQITYELGSYPRFRIVPQNVVE